MPIFSRLTERWLEERVLRTVGRAPIRIVVKNGAGFTAPGAVPVATVTIRDRRTLAELCIDPEVGFGDAYADGRIQVEGDLVEFLEAVYESWPNAPAARSWYARLTSKGMDLWQANTPSGSRRNIHRHYDLGNDFYKLWLDPEMLYTCAYFPTPGATLEEAQAAKMDHICRKLRLQPGETVVEAGCGWGALALYMARHYGVSVKAYNISREQIQFARSRAREEGLNGQVEFIEEDYRNISGNFDVFVSVGMLEHVRADRYAEFGEIIHRTVGDSGRGLLHFIGRSQAASFSRWIRKRIFPGANAPALRRSLEVFERRNYSVLDVENLRVHYVKTLEHWLARFEKSQHQVSAMYDARFMRAWRLYLAGSIAAFRTGSLQLFQIVFAGSELPPLWWTRAFLYSAESGDLEETPEATREATPWIHAMS
jgi:cyclopropane-fatty-acyl-phospholipid synthase